MVDLKTELEAAKTWATSHVVAAFGIGVALGAVLHALLF